MPRAAAEDGVFPKRFERLNRRGAPAFGIVVSTALASIAMIINYLGSNGVTVFTTLVLMTGITAAIPYGFSAAAQIKWRIADQKKIETRAVRPRHDRRGPFGGLLGPLHLLLARHRAQLLGLLGAVPADHRRVSLVGIPVYRSQRNRMTAPAEVPAYR